MNRIRFSPEAVKDLQEIKGYITAEFCSEQAADHTIRKILKKIQNLSPFPEIGPKLSQIADVSTDYRFLACGSYTAFYRVEGSQVFIVRVLYGRRDFMKILFGEPEE